MHSFNVPQQSAQFAADRTRQLRLNATNWRQAHGARNTRVTRPPSKHVEAVKT
jgi:hypothetical protein